MTSDVVSKCPYTGATITADDLEGYDPLDRGQGLDPEPWMSVARWAKPVFYMEAVGQWCVTRGAEVGEVLRDPETFSSADAVTISPLALERMPDGYFLEDAIAAVDPPQHTAMRKFASRFFTARQSESLVSFVTELADRLIDEFVDRGEVDLATEFCQHIPIQVVATMLEVDSARARDLYEWAVNGLMLQSEPNLSDPVRIEHAVETQRQFFDFITGLMAERRDTPERADLITTLVHARSDDGTPSLTEREVVGIVANVLSAGADTAATTIANCLLTLLERRELWERMVADPDLIPRALEETLRHRPPFRMVPRTVTKSVELGGVQFEQGDRLLVHVHSAHRDAALFQDAGEFRLDRENPKDHMGFGKGIHYCIGAPVARMEMRTAMERLVARIPSLRLSPRSAPEYVTGIVVMPIRDGLFVEWDVEAAAR